ncbi:SDR family NAD(P)-dependent oxidoreductase [Candidatus Poribacteria bacterium]|nr:SDR family NAD(P)-dependent oxidoreductase [Candidatus Poribacteria bacterium]MBT5711785.1 SDR family NAD(P)-dependent oxidoreductase [Candidatus Poribacteria bacterium]MBT7100012.1 SDR family NAD(P)-dependent oxidoreductase [Candidatus Poribacteria bacterium]MBT7809244.1 SDR family NAD(P)-dependent oxidoreductase [Candidatus Poribacteria bacterium]
MTDTVPRHVLVTGAAGFIGSHVVDRLAVDGRHVTALDNFDPYYARSAKEPHVAAWAALPNVTFVEADVRDADALADVFASGEVDAVVHLAAKAGVRASVGDDAAYFDVNLTGTLVLLEAMSRHDVKRLVFGASSSSYGNGPAPFREDAAADHPLQPYAASKRSAELLIHSHCHLHGLNAYCTRFFSAYGPRMRPDLAMHKFAIAIANSEELPLLGDGTALRDYTYIEDIVDGIVAALDRARGYEVINLGAGDTTPLRRVIELLETHLGAAARIKRLPANPSDADITRADIGKARRLLDYAPTVSIEDGVARFVAWFRSTIV